MVKMHCIKFLNNVIKMMKIDDNWRGLRNAWVTQVIKQKYGRGVKESLKDRLSREVKISKWLPFRLNGIDFNKWYLLSF